ncbi:MAG: molybdate ABC transporter permease subunit [Planctomycetes bacterium]|nr:molybdate ABC transporter permease subunit [Planctomycetota bacterium]
MDLLSFSREELDALRLSLVVASVAVLGSLPFGVGLGWVLARKDFRGKGLVETLVHLPLVLPPVVTGYVLLVLFGRRGWIGPYLEDWLGLRLVFDWKGAALASAVMAFPLLVRAVRLGFAAVDPRLEEAARTLGAGRLDAFATVTLPLAWGGVAAGCVLAFARSLGEFGATLMIAGSIPGETRTMPLQIYSMLESPEGGAGAGAGRLVALAVVVSVAAVAAGAWLGRSPRASGAP